METKKPKANQLLICIPLLTFVMYFSIEKSLYFLPLILIPFFVMIAGQVKFKRIVLYFIISLIPFLLNCFVNEYSLFQLLSIKISRPLDEYFIAQIEPRFDKRTFSFVLLFLFNQKTNIGYEIYGQIISLSVVYLVVVGGLQINLIRKVINFILPVKKISTIIFILVSTFYWVVLNFNTSITRVMFTLLFSSIFRAKINRYDLLAIVCFFTGSLAPRSFLNFGFALTYFCTAAAIWTNEHFATKYKGVIVNIAATGVSLPFLAAMSQKISLFFVLTSLLFSYVFFAIFIWLLFTIWFSALDGLQPHITNAFVLFIDNIIDIDIKVPLTLAKDLWCTIYYFIVFFAYNFYTKNYSHENYLRKRQRTN